jgi:hypothetical protein
LCFEPELIRPLPFLRPDDKSTPAPGQTWAQAVDIFADYFVSPLSTPHSATAAPTSSLPRLLRSAGPTAFLSSLWNALLASATPTAGAPERFAALLALSLPESGLLETFLVQFVPRAQANLPDSRLPLLEDIVGRVLKLAVGVNDQERVEPLIRAMEAELRGARFASARVGARAARKSGVLGVVEEAVGAAA